MPGYNATSADISTASGANQVAAVDSSSQVTTSQMTTAEGDAALPEQVAYVPVTRPGAKPDAGFPVAIPADAETIAGHTPQPLEQSGQTAEQAGAAVKKTQTADAGAATPKPEGAAPVMNNPVYVTAGEPQPQAPKKSFLASFFSATPASAAPAPVNARSGEQAAVTQVATAQRKATTPTPAKAAVTLASANAAEKPVQLASTDTSNYTSDALPGVRKTALFEIKRKSGLDDESDVDLNEDEGSGSYQVASAAGLARLAPNGLLKQTESVDIACLKPSLVRVLKTIEGHYGRKMVVTSGYRDPFRNRRANGAKNSLHMYCAAADIQVPGVSKLDLANYIRTMPGRGGVGTYCHTESVHVDVGPERDWNWRCRRRG